MARNIKFSKPIKSIYAKSKPGKTGGPQKKGPPVFLGKVFAITGNFGLSNTHTSIERWIICHSGRVMKEVTEETTHLICSIGDYKKKVPQGNLSSLYPITASLYNH
jgi:hypothetical protein